MKKLIFITLLASLLFSCSPQKRLQNLLNKHPELKADSTLYNVTVKDTFVIKQSEKDTTFSGSILSNLSSTAEKNKSVTVTTNRAKATLTFMPNNMLNLKAEQLSDTIYIYKNVTVPVPTYIYKTNYIKKELTTWQRLFIRVGRITFFLVIIIIVLFFLRLFKIL